jgi:hypothetical protein
MIGATRRTWLEGLVAAFAGVALVGCTMLTGAEDLEAAAADCGGRRCTPQSRSETIDQKEQPLPGSKGKGTEKETTADGGSGSASDQRGPLDGGGDAAADKGDAVECGAGSCSGRKGVCCVSDTKTCIGDGDTCGGVRVECGGRESCGEGKVCCLDPGQNWAACASESDCGGSRIVFCRTDADCPNALSCYPTGGSFSEHGACR